MLSCCPVPVPVDEWVEDERVRFLDSKLQRSYEDLSDNYYGFGIADMEAFAGDKIVVVETFECNDYRSMERNHVKKRMTLKKYLRG